MGDLLFAFPIIVIMIICFAAVPLMAMFKKTFGEPTKTKNTPQDARYNRQVHHMHAKDAGTERRHRLDQLKSLYEAGMMEKDEYMERVEAVEADYRGR